MSDAFIRAVRRRLHPDQRFPSPERPTLGCTSSPTAPSKSVPLHNDPLYPDDIQPLPRAHPSSSQTETTIRKRPTRDNDTDIDIDPNAPPSSFPHGSTSTALPSSSANANANPLKRKRKEKAPPPPSRGARYRSHPSRAVLDRHHRSQRHRLYLIERNINDAGTEGTFAVMGANGNVYECKIGLEPSCNCPDFTKRADFGSGHGPCKHLIFVFTRVLKVEMEDPVWWQIRLLSDEVTRVLSSSSASTVDGSCMAEQSVCSMYRAIQQGQSQRSNSQQTSGEGNGNRRPVQGDCPICFEDMGGADQTKAEQITTFCKTCGHNFHKSCFQHWVRSRPTSTCPLCRAEMPSQDQNAEETTEAPVFHNLAQFSTTHTQTMTLAELYADTHQYIGRGGRGGRGRGR